MSAHRRVRVAMFTDLDSPFGVPHFFDLLDTGRCNISALVLGTPGSTVTGGCMMLPDRWGRGVSRDVRAASSRRSIPVFEPDSLANARFVDALRALAPDLIVSAGYRRLLPGELLDMPRLGAINVHPSPLPRVRGRDPWFWSLATGEHTTGVTIHHMVDTVDAGDIVAQSTFAIDSADTASTLRHKTTVEGMRLLEAVIDAAAAGRLPRQAQDADVRRRAFKDPTDRDRMLDWTLSADRIHRLIRASLLTPGAPTSFRRCIVRVTDAELGTDAALWSHSAAPGEIIKATANGVAVKAGEGHIILRRLSVDGQVMPTSVAVEVLGGEASHGRFC